MNKSLTSHQQISYEYALPGDTVKVQANALAMGCLAALRDHPNPLTKQDEIETQARAGCVTLKNSYGAGQGKQLTNDFPLFCDLFIKQYVACYSHDAQVYVADQTFYLNNKEKVDKIGILQVYHFLVEDYISQSAGTRLE